MKALGIIMYRAHCIFRIRTDRIDSTEITAAQLPHFSPYQLHPILRCVLFVSCIKRFPVESWAVWYLYRDIDDSVAGDIIRSVKYYIEPLWIPRDLYKSDQYGLVA
jgi:hypothetical protein